MSEVASPSKFCVTCGNQIHINAELCPKCGVRVMVAQKGGVNKVALLLLTFFFGGLGAHKFYQKKYALGALYLLLCWTYIPAIVAFIEFIIYCVKPEEELRRRYPETANAAIVLVVMFLIGIFFIGIIAAIAIPQFSAYKMKSYNASAISVLKNCNVQAESYLADNLSYPTQAGQMKCSVSDGVAVYFIAYGPKEFQIVSLHEDGDTAYIKSSESTQIEQDSRNGIENELASKFNVSGGYGTFHFLN